LYFDDIRLELTEFVRKNNPLFDPRYDQRRRRCLFLSTSNEDCCFLVTAQPYNDLVAAREAVGDVGGVDE